MANSPYERLLSDSTTIPPVGFGTGGIASDVAAEAGTGATSVDYRLIDVCVNYETELEVGAGIQRPGDPRDGARLTVARPASTL